VCRYLRAISRSAHKNPPSTPLVRQPSVQAHLRQYLLSHVPCYCPHE
jgi:hypothetical protein